MEEQREGGNNEEVVKKKRSWLRRLIRFAMYVFLGLFTLNIVLYLLLSIPAVQKMAVDFATDTLKDKLKTEVSIDEIRLSLFNHATVRGIYIEDMAKDTLLYANYLDVKINPWRLIKGTEIAITGLTLDDFLVKVNQKDSVSDFNFQFLIDAFSSGDSTQVDTTSSALKIHINDIRIDRGRLQYDVFSVPETPAVFNASHILLSDLHANIDARSIDVEKLDVALNSLSVKEKSGLEIKSLSGRIRSKGTNMWVDDLILSLPHSHLATNKAVFDLKTNVFELGTQDTEIDVQDLLAVMPELKHLKEKLGLKLEVSGQLPFVVVKQLDLNYGDACVVNARASIANYEDYANSDILFAIDEFKMSPRAITDFAKLADSTFVTPAILDTIGIVQFTGRVQGKLSKLDIESELRTQAGSVFLKAKGGADTTFQNFDVDAKLYTTNLNLGRLLGRGTGLGNFSFHTNMQAKQTTRSGLMAKLSGAIDEFQYEKESFQAIAFDASYDPQIAQVNLFSDTQLGGISANASMTQGKIADVALKLNLDDFDIARLVDNKAWTKPRLTLRLNANLNDLDIDNMTGKVSLDSLHFYGDNFEFTPGSFLLKMTKLGEHEKDITFTSALATANVHGEYKFTTLYTEIANIMHKCMPSIFEQTKTATNEHDHSQNFKFNLKVNNTQSYSQIFGLPMDLLQPLNVSGEINSYNHQLRMQADAPRIKFDDMLINDTKLSLANHDSTFHIRSNALVRSNINKYKVNFSMDGKADTIRNTLNVVRDNVGFGMNGTIDTWAHIKKDAKGDLISTLHFIPSDILFGKMQFNLKPSTVVYADDRVTINDFALNLNKKEFFEMAGAVSKDPEDKLKLIFMHAELGDVLKGMDINNFAAAANGEVVLGNLFNSPEVAINDFMVYDITVNTDTLGTLSIDSRWSEKPEGLLFDATLQKNLSMIANISGNIPNNNDSIDFHFLMREFDIHWLEPLTAGLLTKVEGSISSDIRISGTNKKPKMEGFLGFNKTSLGIDFTNVVYSVSDTIKISSDYIGFKNLQIKDDHGNIAQVNASVTHKEYKDFKLDMDMNLKNFMVMNTMHRTDSLFYGRIFASGRVNVKGDKKAFNVNMQVRNEKRSALNILLPQTAEASEYKSVVYINTPVDTTAIDEDDFIARTPIKEPTIPIILKVALDINPDLALGVVIDPKTGDAMTMKGTGSINFTYDLSKDLMTTYGRYELKDGSVKLNLQKVKTIEFKMRDGSSLSFIGDPFKTKFDIAAYRRVKADLKTLDNSFESESQSTKVQVDCDLGITGDMNKMDLKYGISLPNASDDYQRKVNSLINTDEEKIKQFAYLVASGSFYPSAGSSGANFTDGLWTNLASSTISSGLNMALGNILGDKWEIGTNLESNDGTFSNMDMSVNVSTRLFDDKLKLNTNLGYRTDNTTASDNAFIGDFEAEYQLNKTWTLNGYNKTNDRFYRQAPTTQGVGFAYTKDATTLKRLFQAMRRRRKRKPIVVDTTTQRKMEVLKVSMDSLKQSMQVSMDSLRLVSDSIAFDRKIDMKELEIIQVEKEK